VTGGILAWRGERLPHLPNLRAFADTESLDELLIAALDLEKGAHRLYEALHQAFTGTPLENTLKKLTWVEVGHEKIIYRQLQQKGSEDVPPFEELMGKLRGDVIESGEPLDAVLATARRLSAFGGAAVLELALELELRAFDMYRALAHDSNDPEFREVFLDLANQERTHAREVLDAIAKITGDKTSWMG
jgi:rubrerythrin